jgi:serine protease Do
MRSFTKLAEDFKNGDALRVMLDRRGDQVFALVKLPRLRKKNDE